MKVLVTGARGFIGSNVVRHLRDQGHDVRAGVRTAVNPGEVAAELGDRRGLDAACDGVQTVVHAAARLGQFGSRRRYWEDNVDGTRRLLSAAASSGVRRFVFVSSPSALMSPEDGDRFGIDESMPYPNRFLNAYCETKAEAERIVLDSNADGFTTVALRPRAVWGPGDRHGPVAKVIDRMRAGTMPDLNRGRQVHVSICHIDNFVSACGAALQADAQKVGGRSYFVADDRPVELGDALERLAGALGLTPPTRTVPAVVLTPALAVIEAIWSIPAVGNRVDPPLSRYSVALLTRSATYDLSAARRDLNWQPLVDFDTALEGLAAHE